MAINEDILELLLDQNVFEDRDRMVAGLAQRAVDNNLDSLTPNQRYHIAPYLTQRCDGYTDLGGDKYECSAVLVAENLKEALEARPLYGSLLCESCRAEIDYQSYRREKLDRE
ncbi:hypothetical protein ACRQTN_14430 [Pectobacterium brasiliense]|uniref:hypothetical protein n=1 Tax=Pectobacterium brasiliense TaxID=180957 RepID=UPI003EB7309C